MIKEVLGDLVVMAKSARFDAIIHGCNCFCTMGAGVARQISREFPEALVADKRTKRGDIAKLGTYSKALARKDGTAFSLYVYNAYTQYQYGRKEQYVDYEALSNALRAITADLLTKGANTRVGLPRIGAGLGGGNWRYIRTQLDDIFKPLADVTIVTLP